MNDNDRKQCELCLDYSETVQSLDICETCIEAAAEYHSAKNERNRLLETAKQSLDILRSSQFGNDYEPNIWAYNKGVLISLLEGAINYCKHGKVEVKNE